MIKSYVLSNEVHYWHDLTGHWEYIVEDEKCVETEHEWRKDEHEEKKNKSIESHDS